jgi:signal transduction histidine kinase
MCSAAPPGSAWHRDRDRHQGLIIDQRPERLPAQPPTVSAPPGFKDRRLATRRTEDRIAHQEKVLLARALDVLASDSTAEERLAGLLRLLARTVGARRAAVVADGIERRAAVAIDPDEDPAMAEALAGWLDSHAPRTRAQRVAAARAPISLIIAAVAGVGEEAQGATGSDRGEAPDGIDAHYAVVPIPSAGVVALGFEFRRPADAERLADRLPPTLARHAAVALALVTSQLASERELADLRARDAERSTFVSTVAHELRTPLTGLRGYLELILGGRVADPAVERDFLERSRSIVDSMGELVGDLLELSRLESGTLGLEIGPFSLAEAGGQAAAGILPIAIERGIRLTTALPPRLQAATADRRRVEQILTNLAANALKFTPAGGTVEIEGRFDGLVAVLTVRDDGAGIPLDDRDRIFERFHRMAGHERITGTGLGLPIARDLARRMNGDVGVASVPDAGSAFVMVLPGPTEVSPETISAALASSLTREEQNFEERLVRRAVAAGRAAAALGASTTSGATARRSASPPLRILPPPRPGSPTPA